MKIARFLLMALLSIALVWALDNRHVIGNNPVPPLGRFLDPLQGFWQNAEAGFSAPDSWQIPGLKNKVSIYYDSALIPHIFAENDEDLYLAQGFVTASHRLWQMEFQTHAAAGRISEIIGQQGQDYDRTQRRLGMVYAAKNALRAMEQDPKAAMMVEQYAKGVNAFIEQLSYRDLPFEYKLLAYKPEAWTNLKSALLLKSMAQTLNIGDKDLQMTNALKLYGLDIVDILYPAHEGVGDPIVDNPGGWDFERVELDDVPLALPDELITAQAFEPGNPNVGSNNWAVHGSKTNTGSPMLANDPHLNMSLPSIWYVAHLNAPGINCMGASLPGAPGVISGFNEHVAWGVTNAQRDLVDWYKMEFEDASMSRYKLDGRWANTGKQIDTLKIRGGKIFIDTITWTHWGPVVIDKSFMAGTEKENFAFRWVSHDPSNEVLTFYKLNRAKNHDDYMDALNHFHAPAQNFVFASVSGDIAMRIQGKYPVRRKNEGRFVLDGSNSNHGWKAYIPFEQNVMYKNPERGFASSANQYPVDETYPYFVHSTSFEAYRNRRINQVLAESQNISVKDMMKLQLDNYNLKAAEILPYLLEHTKTENLNEQEKLAYDILSKWNYYHDINEAGASYFVSWWSALYNLIWDEMRNSEVLLPRPTDYTTIKLLKTNPDFEFFDIRETPEKENAFSLINQSFATAVKRVEDWKAEKSKDPSWADFKDTFVQHLARLEQLSEHVEHGGTGDAVNACSRTHGPSWRMVVSLESEGVKAWGVYPGGQSGNPGSKYYNDLLKKWSKGEYLQLDFNASAAAYQSYPSTTLKP
ncbi:MAG TPA: penicillin acylase family protein [Cyclobacteriaceae bacterium]|nr:penicillin acylase family protein [Cyclobacteriaceae bacterium]